MNNIIEPYIDDYLNNKLSDLEIFRLKNKIYECVRSEYKFTHKELVFVCEYFWRIAQIIKPSKELFLASIEAEGPSIGTKAFIKKMCAEDNELAKYIYNKWDYFPEYLQKYITLDDFYKKIEHEEDTRKIYSAARNAGFLKSSNNKNIRQIKQDKELWNKIKHGKAHHFELFEYYDDYDENSIEINSEIIEGQQYCLSDIRLVNNNYDNFSVETVDDISTFDLKRNKYIFHYISDLHLDNKISKSKTKQTSINLVIDEVILKAIFDIEKCIDMYNNLQVGDEIKHVLLIAGDISYDMEIVRKFFKKLNEVNRKNIRIFYVLGNHELWRGNPFFSDDRYNLDTIIKEYKEMIKNYYNITLLNNDICFVMQNNSDIVVTYDEVILGCLDKGIEDVLSSCEYIVYGGTGFAGNNEKFNCNSGLYRNLIIDRDTEKTLSIQHSYVLNKILQVYNNNDLICLTHMSPQDWYDFQGNSANCHFISGHTHKNTFLKNSNGTFYADRQIGYDNNSFFTKRFFINLNMNMYNEYLDGIYPIKPVDYDRIIGGNVSLRMLFNDQLFLLCKDGVKMFIAKNKLGALHIINGGQKKRLEHKDIDYYYNNLSAMANFLYDSFEGFNDYINKVSRAVKELGGSGYIHGCIVDIDSMNNKIYVNPFNGIITPYVAPELYSGKRIVYESIYQLLRKTPCKTEEIINMNNRLLKNKDKYSLIKINQEKLRKIRMMSDDKRFVLAYKVSKKIKKIQSLFDNNILKEWDETFVKEYQKKKLLR